MARRVTWESTRVEYRPKCHRANRQKRKHMHTYECSSCGMTVNATCGACDAPLVNDVLTRDDGSTVQISKCPNGHGKIKSPLCCGADMTCSIA
jgi:hypothetical protein